MAKRESIFERTEVVLSDLRSSADSAATSSTWLRRQSSASEARKRCTSAARSDAPKAARAESVVVDFGPATQPLPLSPGALSSIVQRVAAMAPKNGHLAALWRSQLPREPFRKMISESFWLVVAHDVQGKPCASDSPQISRMSRSYAKLVLDAPVKSRDEFLDSLGEALALTVLLALAEAFPGSGASLAGAKFRLRLLDRCHHWCRGLRTSYEPRRAWLHNESNVAGGSGSSGDLQELSGGLSYAKSHAGLPRAPNPFTALVSSELPPQQRLSASSSTPALRRPANTVPAAVVAASVANAVSSGEMAAGGACSSTDERPLAPLRTPHMFGHTPLVRQYLKDVGAREDPRIALKLPITTDAARPLHPLRAPCCDGAGIVAAPVGTSNTSVASINSSESAQSRSSLGQNFWPWPSELGSNAENVAALAGSGGGGGGNAAAGGWRAAREIRRQKVRPAALAAVALSELARTRAETMAAHVASRMDADKDCLVIRKKGARQRKLLGKKEAEALAMGEGELADYARSLAGR